jgi:hypothetical protein
MTKFWEVYEASYAFSIKLISYLSKKKNWKSSISHLKKRLVIVVIWCYLCKRNGESVDHLVLHCEVSCATWNEIFSRIGLSWVMPRRVVDLFAC